MVTMEPRTIGQPTHGRAVAGAVVLLAGAVVLAAFTLAGVANPWLLLSLGVTAVLAWLVDGTSTRYLGPGLVAVAAGLGILVGNALDMDPRAAEHTLVYGGFGAALLLISYVNPMASRASGAFLLYTGLTVWAVGFSKGWWLTAILAVWGAYWLVRTGRGEGVPRPRLDESPAGEHRADRYEERRPTPAGTRG